MKDLYNVRLKLNYRDKQPNAKNGQQFWANILLTKIHGWHTAHEMMLSIISH